MKKDSMYCWIIAKYNYKSALITSTIFRLSAKGRPLDIFSPLASLVKIFGRERWGLRSQGKEIEFAELSHVLPLTISMKFWRDEGLRS